LLAEGMSLRITYWGDKAETMEWMDIPPCGKQACSGGNAGRATISDMSIGPVSQQALTEWPTAQAPKKQADEWIFSDPRDKLHGEVVPKELMEDKEHSAFLRGRGIVEWKGSPHYVAKRGEEPCDDATANPCATLLSSEAGFMNMLAKKYNSFDAIGGHLDAGRGSLSWLAWVSLFATLAACVALGVRRFRHPGDVRQNVSDRQVDSSSRSAAAGANTSGAGAAAADSDGGLSRRRPASSNALSALGCQPQTLNRSGSSCQRLLGLVEQHAE